MITQGPPMDSKHLWVIISRLSASRKRFPAHDQSGVSHQGRACSLNVRRREREVPNYGQAHVLQLQAGAMLRHKHAVIYLSLSLFLCEELQLTHTLFTAESFMNHIYTQHTHCALVCGRLWFCLVAVLKQVFSRTHRRPVHRWPLTPQPTPHVYLSIRAGVSRARGSNSFPNLHFVVSQRLEKLFIFFNFFLNFVPF